MRSERSSTREGCLVYRPRSSQSSLNKNQIFIFPFWVTSEVLKLERDIGSFILSNLHGHHTGSTNNVKVIKNCDKTIGSSRGILGCTGRHSETSVTNGFTVMHITNVKLCLQNCLAL